MDSISNQASKDEMSTNENQSSKDNTNNMQPIVVPKLESISEIIPKVPKLDSISDQKLFKKPIEPAAHVDESKLDSISDQIQAKNFKETNKDNVQLQASRVQKSEPSTLDPNPSPSQEDKIRTDDYFTFTQISCSRSLQASNSMVLTLPNLDSEQKGYAHVYVAGTFDRLHEGHAQLLSRALELGGIRRKGSEQLGELTIGVTSDAYVDTFASSE